MTSHPKKIIHSDKLYHFEGIYSYSNYDRRYTGLSLIFSENGELEEVRNIEDGIDQGVTNELFSQVDAKRISEQVIELDYDYDELGIERYIFEEDAFEGYTYVFNSQGYLVEEFCINPERKRYRQWYSNGQLKLDHRESNQHKTWYRDGNLETIRYYQSEKLIYLAKYTRTGSLFYLYIDKIDILPTQIFFHDRLAINIYLAGAGIDDELIGKWWDEKSYVFNSIIVENTNLTPNSFHNLKKYLVNRIEFRSNVKIAPADIVQFEANNTFSMIVFNNRIIEHEAKKRVLLSSLESRDNLLSRDGELFTGIAYRLDLTKKIQRILNVRSGVAVDKCLDVLESNQNLRRVYRQELTENTPFVKMGKPKYFLDGEEFVGISYYFEDEVLTREEYYSPDLIKFREWYEDGRIKYEVDQIQRYEWYINGQLHRYVAEGLEERYFDDGLLYWLKLDNLERLEYFELNRYLLAQEVKIIGKGINDELLECLLSDRRHEFLKELTIIAYNISDDIVDEINFWYPKAKINWIPDNYW